MDKQQELYLKSNLYYLESLENSLCALESEKEFNKTVIELSNKSIEIIDERIRLTKKLIEEIEDIVKKNQEDYSVEYECIEELEIINEDKSITKYEKHRTFKLCQLPKWENEKLSKYFKIINNGN